jgi:tetrahydromethanopterin S-methyltransferase subunit D
MNKLSGFVCLLAATFLLPAAAIAQEKPEMADLMRSNGKIYVVVAVCLTVLVGLFIYLITLDSRISRIEKRKD